MRISRAYIFAIFILLVAACQKDSPSDDSQNQGGTTSSANDFVRPNHFLAADKYDKLVIEVQYVRGFEPTPTAITNMTKFLDQRINKPGGIEIVQKEVVSPGKDSYTLDDIGANEKRNRTQNTSGTTLTAYIFFADGSYALNNGDSKVVGFAYGTSSIVVFEKTINEFSGGLSQPSRPNLETIVLNHEFGHTLGLVNRGTPLQSAHVDASHANHCNNENCLMYYQAEAGELAGGMLGAGVSTLDAACIADLRANGGK